MDPNTTLAMIRRIADLTADTDTDDLSESDIQSLSELAVLISSLDAWITGGGFLPDAWQRN